jgi:hypothetical protein
MRKPSYPFGSLLAPGRLHLSIKRQTTVRAGVAFCERIFSSYCDAETRETLRYIFEKVVAPIGAAGRHDLRLELLYLYRMYRPDTPLAFITPIPAKHTPARGIRGPNERQIRLRWVRRTEGVLGSKKKDESLRPH